MGRPIAYKPIYGWPLGGIKNPGDGIIEGEGDVWCV